MSSYHAITKGSLGALYLPYFPTYVPRVVLVNMAYMGVPIEQIASRLFEPWLHIWWIWLA